MLPPHFHPVTPLLTGGRNARTAQTVSSYEQDYLDEYGYYMTPQLLVPPDERIHAAQGCELRLDWLQGTVRLSPERFLEFCDILPRYLPDDRLVFETPNGFTRCGKLYENIARSPGGIFIRYNGDVSQDKEIDISYQIYGKFLSALEPFACVHLLWTLLQFGCKHTRIDALLVDFERRLEPEQLYEWAKLGLVRGPRVFSYHSGVHEVTQHGCLKRGDTVYFGSRESDKCLRVYDGLNTHDSWSVRWELELKGGCAKVFADRLYSLRDSFIDECRAGGDCQEVLSVISDLIAATIMGSLYFVSLESAVDGRRLSRSDVLPEWEEFVIYAASTGTIKTVAPRTKPTFDSQVRWLVKQVAPTMAMMSKILGPADFPVWFYDFLSDGISRLSEFQCALIQLIRGHQSSVEICSFS